MRVLIADDHPAYRRHLRDLVEKEAGIRVVGEVEDGRAAVTAARELEPDLVLMDVAMPELGGVEATRQVVAALPQVRVIALSMHRAPELVDAMLQAGASGYVLKDSVHRDFCAALRQVSDGGAWLSPELR